MPTVPAPKQNPPLPTSTSGGTLDAIAIVQTADASAPNAQAIDTTITPNALIKAKSDDSGVLVDAVADVDYATPAGVAAAVGAGDTSDNAAVAAAFMRAKIRAVCANGIETVAWPFMKNGSDGWNPSLGGASTDGTRQGGIRKIVTSGGGGDAVGQFVEFPVAFNTPPNSPADCAWGVAYRSKFVGLVEAATHAYVGLGQGPEALISFGIQGSISLTKYVVQPYYTVTPAVVLSGGPNIAAGYQWLYLVFDKTKLWASADGVTWTEVAVAADVYPSYAYLVWYLKEGATASVRSLSLDTVVFCVEAQA